MKAVLILLLFAASIFLTGCAVDPEDKRFYEQGWVRPGDIDRPFIPRAAPAKLSE